MRKNVNFGLAEKNRSIRNQSWHDLTMGVMGGVELGSEGAVCQHLYGGVLTNCEWDKNYGLRQGVLLQHSQLKALSLESNKSGIASQLSHLVNVWPWESHLTSQSSDLELFLYIYIQNYILYIKIYFYLYRNP